MIALDKIIYDVREALNAISDDRYVDQRYILNVVNRFRSDYYRKLLSRKPYYNTQGIEQSIPIHLDPVDKSVFPNVEANCKVLRSINHIPALVYEASNSNWFSVKTADVTNDTIETIGIERVPYLTFEFTSVYSFLGIGKTIELNAEIIADDYYLYVIAKDRFEMEYAILTGIFEDPLAANPNTKVYPIKQSDWAAILPLVLNYLAGRPADDPLNNSERDEGKSRREDTSRENKNQR